MLDWDLTHLLHELEEDIQQLRYEGLDLLQAVSVKGVDETAQRNHCIHSNLHAYGTLSGPGRHADCQPFWHAVQTNGKQLIKKHLLIMTCPSLTVGLHFSHGQDRQEQRACHQ